MQHHYQTNIQWTGNKGEGTSGYAAYERSHTLQVNGKKEWPLSSDTPFRGNAQFYNPEDLLLASLSSCHMLWYLHLCADAGVIVEHYEDHAEGWMETGNGQLGRFTKVVLHPNIHVQREDMIALAKELHANAHEQCFIANSVNFEVTVEADIQATM